MNKSRMWMIAAPIAGVLVLLVGWFALVSGSRTTASDLRAQADQTLGNNISSEAQLASLKKQALTLSAQKAKLAAVRSKIPVGPEQRAFVTNVSTLATNSGVSLKSISFTAPGAAAAGSTSSVTPLPVTLTASGTYAQLKLFAASLETMPRAFLVGTLGISKAGSTATGGGATANPDLDATIQGTTFMAVTFSAPSTSAPAAGAATTGTPN